MEFVPYERVGEIRFGMPQAKVHELLGDPDPDFFDDPEEAEGKEGFPVEGLIVEYDGDQNVGSLRFLAPAAIDYAGHDLLQMPYDEMQKHFGEKDSDMEIDEAGMGFNSKKFGVSVYFVSAEDEPKGFVDFVILYAKDFEGEVYP